MPSFGNLFASLTLESASFMSGIRAAQKQISETQRTFAAVGAKMQTIGVGMSAAITAPLAGIAAGALGSAKAMADSLPELQRMATTAGTTVEQLQRMAFASKTVGIEQDKLGDILKDTQDKIGDFIATGGGEMKDFFETIAPKVGVTADMFRRLSGPDALQLYASTLQRAGVSQAEFVFYMESIADEASGLIPLLKDNGAAMTELGKGAATLTPEATAQLQAYTKAQTAMANATQKLTIAFVESGLLGIITDLVTKVAEATASFAKANPTVFKWGAIVGGLAAAMGPGLIAIGGLLKLMPIGPLLNFAKGLTGIGIAAGTTSKGAVAAGIAVRGLATSLFSLLLNPVFLGAAAAIGAIYLAWKNWDRITAIAKGVYEGVKVWVVDKLGGVLKWVTDKVAAVTGAFKDMYIAVVGNSFVPDMVDEIGQHMRRLQGLMVDPAIAANDNVARSFEDTAKSVAASVQSMVSAIKSGDIGGIIGGIVDVLAGTGVIKGPSAASLLGKGNGITSANAIDLSGYRANGGPVLPRGDYLVGERGPEILRMGGRRGNIIPNDQLGASGATYIFQGNMMTPEFFAGVRAESAATGGRLIMQNNQAQAFRRSRQIA